MHHYCKKLLNKVNRMHCVLFLIYCFCTFIGSYYIYFLDYSKQVIFGWIFLVFVCFSLIILMIQSNLLIQKKLYGGFPAVASYNTHNNTQSVIRLHQQPRTPNRYSLLWDDNKTFCDPISLSHSR